MRTLLAILITTLTTQLSLHAECVVPKRKPIKISGALCGTVLSWGEPMPDFDVSVYDKNQPAQPVATIRADQKGNFQFGLLPKGEYRVGGSGYLQAYPAIQLQNTEAEKCKDRVFVHLVVADECGSWATRKAPRQ
jgi:hypothetical protein